MVKSLSDPKNLEESSKSLTRSLTREPRTYSLEEKRFRLRGVHNGCLSSYSLSVLGWPGTDTVEFPAEINVQVIADNVKDPSGDDLILGVAQLEESIYRLGCILDHKLLGGLTSTNLELFRRVAKGSGVLFGSTSSLCSDCECFS